MAQPVSGPYVNLGVGYNHSFDQNIKNLQIGNVNCSISNSDLTTNGGILGSVAAGYGLGDGWRFELMGDYRNYHQNFEYTSPNGNTTLTSRKSFLNQTYGAMVNALYDFDVGLDWLHPYVGVGVGYEETKAGSNFTSSDGSAAGQFLFGTTWPIQAVPGLAIQTQFRFMGTFQDEKFHGGPNNGYIKVGSQVNFGTTIGVLYAFNQPPPPPPPPPRRLPRRRRRRRGPIWCSSTGTRPT